MITVSNKTHWLIEHASAQNSTSALRSSEEKFHYNELNDECIRTAEHFSKLGIKENANVGLLFGHKIDFWIITNALWLLGAVPVPLNSRNTPQEINEQIVMADIKFLIVDINFQEYATPGKYFPSLGRENIFLFDRKDVSKNSAFSTLNSEFEKNHSALILFTSGSSGKSKAVVHTFMSLYQSVKQIDSLFSLSREDVWLASLPLYHIGGFMILVRALLTGSQAAFPESLKHEEIAAGINRYSPTHISIVPTTLKRMMEENFLPNKNLKYVYLGGGPSDKQLCLNACNAGWPIVKVYGSSETCSMVAALKPSKLTLMPESSGKPLGENQIRISNDPMSSGEILVHSTALFKEYFNDKETTDAKLNNGWFHTGDYGRIDEEGYLFVHSRREDMIITGGENVSAQEVEEAIKSVIGIRDAFVFGTADATWGQIVCAAVTGNLNDEEEIRRSLKEKLAGYKIPKQFYFLESIPKNEMGKVKRAELFSILKLN